MLACALRDIFHLWTESKQMSFPQSRGQWQGRESGDIGNVPIPQPS